MVPYRDGDHTAWMGEHQIARAYRVRFVGHDQRDQTLTAQWAAARDLVVEPVGEEAWVIFASRLAEPPDLATMRAETGFRPPQRYRYLTAVDPQVLHLVVAG